MRVSHSLFSRNSSAKRCFARHLSFVKQPPLVLPLKENAEVASSFTPKTEKPKIETLKNGTKFVSLPTNSHVVTLGALMGLPASSQPFGHLLEHVVMMSTTQASALATAYKAQTNCINCSSSSTRDTFCLALDFLPEPQFTTAAAELLGAALYKNRFTLWDIDEKSFLIEDDYKAFMANPEARLEQAVHQAAFGVGRGLGINPIAQDLKSFGEYNSREFVSKYRALTSADNCVIVSTGLSDEENTAVKDVLNGIMEAPRQPPSEEYLKTLKDYQRDYFAGELETEVDYNLFGDYPINQQKYKGGNMFIEDNGPLSGVAVGFQGPGWKTSSMEEIVNATVLFFLLGGGGSFSSGGPGKGLYSRLYQRVLTRHLFTEQCNGFNHIYDNTGVFGIQGLCPSSHIAELTGVILEQLKLLGQESDYSEQEVARAKKQTESALIMKLEENKGKWEDIGRQVLVYGKVNDVQEYVQAIQKVNAGSLANFAKTMMSKGKLSFAGLGEVGLLPEYEEIQNYLK